MCKPATEVYPPVQMHESLIRADALEQEISDLCARINAAGYRLLQLIAELDDLQPWGSWGLNSCAHWLNWRCGIGLNAAREKVRVAHALKGLPLISSAYESGQLSFSRVRALTRIAKPANEALLLNLAFHATAAQVEKLVRAYRRVEGQAERDQAMLSHARRELDYYHDDDGSLVIRARLPAEQGAVVLQALNAIMDDAAKDVTAVTSEHENRFAQRRADALTTMAETALKHGPESLSAAERYQVVVQVTAETLAEGVEGRCELGSGHRIAPDTARRITCDASLLRITEDTAGNPLDIGRKTHAVPPAMQRALRSRDGGCCFPGCTCERFVDAHHIRHWANGGETSLDNLVLLCRRHHRLVHEGGFGLERDADGNLKFTRPDGRAIDEHPQLPIPHPVAGFPNSILAAGDETVDAAEWIIPGDKLDLHLAISGLMDIEQRNNETARFN